MALRLILGSIVATYVLFRIVWALLRQYMVQTTLVLKDLDRFAHVRSSHEKIQGTAVIAGGSIAGYLTARILTDYFTKVVIVEIDTRLQLRSLRVPQRAQLHILHPISIHVLRHIFPGFDRETPKNGAHVLNGWFRWHIGGRLLAYKPKDTPDGLHLSRLTLEALVRRLVEARAGSALEVVRGTVVGVQASKSGTHIQSVSYRPAGEVSEDSAATSDAAQSPIQTIETAFFADCTGGSAAFVKLLSAAGAGWGPYTRHWHDPHVDYTTTIIDVPAKAREAISLSLPKDDHDFGRWDRHTAFDVFTPTADVEKEYYIVQKVDNDRISLLHGGWSIDKMPATYSEFVESVDSIQTRALGHGTKEWKKARWLLDMLKILGESIENIDEVAQFIPLKIGQCQWIDFSGASLPANFAAIGDSRFRLNPAFAQGISKALMDITELNASLDSLLPRSPSEVPLGFSQDFLTRATPPAMAFYDINRVMDYGYDTTIPQAGQTLAYGRWFRKYWRYVLKLSNKDETMAAVVVHVLSGIAPGIDIFHPWFAAKVFLEYLRPQ